MDAYKEEICRKLRLTESEFGHSVMKMAVIIHPEELFSSIGGVQCIYCSTIPWAMLGGVPFKVARFFEEI